MMFGFCRLMRRRQSSTSCPITAAYVSSDSHFKISTHLASTSVRNLKKNLNWHSAIWKQLSESKILKNNEKNPQVGRHRDVRRTFKFNHLCISEGEITCTVHIYWDRVGQSMEKNRSRKSGTTVSLHAKLRGYPGRISIFYIRYVISFCNIDCTRMNCISNVNCTIQYMRSTYNLCTTQTCLNIFCSLWTLSKYICTI
jgi:hypothetical protein